ncbi:MAG: phosphoribosylanthranilate isomerase [Halioglobus sp.]|nr:phosphoribosylanthranilate isomerase [Halioglobus sp.]
MASSRSKTRIKICGITRQEDACAAVAAGADALGLNFYAPSPRSIDTATARELVASVPPFVTIVALFVDEPAESVLRILEAVPIDMLQFHGDESPQYCAQFHRPWLKAVRMKDGVDLAEVATAYSGARGLLLDSWREGVPGGTGETFDWTRVSDTLALPLLLAGGLNPANVGAAIAQLQPAAVDVAGGVESAPGIKDAGKMTQFIEAVRAADRAINGAGHDQ